jgi:hypothetical protein
VSAARELSDVGYEPAPESKTPLNMRAPKSLVVMLDEIVKLWKLQATARGEDPTNIDRTHVAVTLLKTATAGEFDAYGGRPKDEAGWDRIKKAISEGTRTLKSTK